jgi:hypothetical protein
MDGIQCGVHDGSFEVYRQVLHHPRLHQAMAVVGKCAGVGEGRLVEVGPVAGGLHAYSDAVFVHLTL